MNFEEMVEDLSVTYKQPRSKMYDTLLLTEYRLLIRQPLKYALRPREQRVDAYTLLDRYMAIKQAQENNK